MDSADGGAHGVAPLASVRVHEPTHDVVVATITGEIDLSNVEQVGAALFRVPNLALGLVVDLTDVEYLDSTAISMLHDLAERLRQRSQQLVVVCPLQAPPRRVLDLAGLPRRAIVVDALQAAIAGLTGASHAAER